MSKPIHPMALFRLSVLGPLASRDNFLRGELKTVINDLAGKTYSIPGSKRNKLTPQIIEKWYYAWKRNGIEALAPKERADKNISRISDPIKDALLQFKKDNQSRSLNTLLSLLELQGIAAKGELSRATAHRFLKSMQLSKRTVADAPTIERRSFVAQYPGDIWYGDVMHGPKISTSEGMRKIYLVSLMDDASRLIAHTAFCFGETALDIEGVLKQALLKRGLPKKLIVDNGSAYRTNSLQKICVKLGVKLIHSRPYEPESKAKIERFHKSFRNMFLNEINLQTIRSIDEINARLWVWIEQFYHQRPHKGLNNQTPLFVWRQNLVHIQPLGTLAQELDDIFCHRIDRHVNKDGTVSIDGKFFEVPYKLSGLSVVIVIDPHANKPLWVESKDGKKLGAITPRDLSANLHRHRQRPDTIKTTQTSDTNIVESTYNNYCNSIGITNNFKENK